jgi:PAS domain S-box-containing protein
MDALNYGKSIDVEYRFFGKNGEIRFARSQGEVETDETGTWVHGTLHDITEHKRTEQALRKSEEQYRLIIDNASEGIFVAQDGILRFLNPGVEAIWGYSREELLSLSFLDFIHPEDRDVVTATHFNRLQSRGGLKRTSFRIITKDGSIKWAEISDVLIEWEGKPATLNFATDITERKQAEEALRSEKDFAETLVETAQVIVLVLDTEGRIVRFNPYMEDISGYCLQEVQGKDWFTTFLPERDQERIRAIFSQAIDDIQTRSNVNPIVTKDGCERKIEWNDKTLKDADGNIVGLLAIGQDITERKRTEE